MIFRHWKEEEEGKNKKNNNDERMRKKWCNELYGGCQERYYWCPLRIEELEEEYEDPRSRGGEEERKCITQWK